jgi:alanyl-tRNA synthetase
MRAEELRTRYLSFFAERGHERVASSSLVPEDPTLLFTSAGMVQFKDLFWGRVRPQFPKAVSAQKCFRTTDIESVGRTAFHHTFFEMLGNFSFGDYFKEGAVRLAWEFLIDELGLAPDRIWVSVYEEDDEAYALWEDMIGIPTARIQRLGKKHNWWGPVGESGPCGPDSEIFYDMGEAHGCGPQCRHLACDCDRFSEIWNLVFMQYEAQPGGELSPLETNNVDTGMGLERTSSALQGVVSDYAGDLFLPLIEAVESLVGEAVPEELHRERHVVADHIRGVVALVADGVLPSNERQGYVLRRILRRAVRASRTLGLEERRLATLVNPVIETLGSAYPEMASARALAERVIAQEEESFLRTLRAGEARLNEVLERLLERGAKELPGDVAFELYDTFGFPVEMTREIAAERGVAIDQDGFDRGMAAQRDRSRAQTSGPSGDADLPVIEGDATRFVGYDVAEVDATLLKVLEDGDTTRMVFDASPFYATAGGQVADSGTIENQSRKGAATVEDVRRLPSGIVLHTVRVVGGSFEEGDRCALRVDAVRRRRIERNHTATHLLHRALRNTLGDHVTQAGSQVAAEELRFDFTHYEPMSADQLRDVEDLVNAIVLDDALVTTAEMGLEEAIASGAAAQFGDEYRGKDTVRVVSVDDFSRELCAGTHVRRSGEIGLLHITSEEGIAAGTRRIRAVTGDAVLRKLREREAVLSALRGRLGDDPLEGLRRVDDELEALRSAARAADEQDVAARVEEIVSSSQSVDEVSVFVARADGLSVDQLKDLADRVVATAPPAVAILAAETEGRALVVCKRTLEADKIDAGSFVKTLSARLGGGGGGSPQFAQGGGPKTKDLDEALRDIQAILLERLQ